MVKKYTYRKIALIGGSFDPPHHGHVMMAKWLLKKHRPHQVWLMLSKQNRLKDTQPASMQQRYEWCKNYSKSYQIQPKMLEQHIPYYDTYSILQTLKRRYNRYQFIFAIGGDNLLNIHQWQHFALLPALMPIAVIARACPSQQRLKQQLYLRKHLNWRNIPLKNARKWRAQKGYYIHRNRLNNTSSTSIRARQYAA